MDAVPTVALITSEYALSSPIDADRELDLIVGALAERGVDGRVIDWRDPSADYSGLDLVLIKSPWDYAPRAAEFLAWLAKAEALAPVLNHPELVRWNLDKTYLAALAARGVAVCPTEFCGRIEDVQAALAAAAGQVVLKPSVSAASADTGLFDPDDRAAMRLAEQIFAQGKVVMVQPAETASSKFAVKPKPTQIASTSMRRSVPRIGRQSLLRRAIVAESTWFVPWAAITVQPWRSRIR